MSDASSVDSMADKKKRSKAKKEKITPHINDIVSGRGSGSNRHEGNLYFRKLIRENKQLYLSRSKNEKMQVARDIYTKIGSLNPSGRFLQKNPETGTWFKIGLSRALEKISQALREKNTKHQSQSTHHHQQANTFVTEQQVQNRFLDGSSNDASFGEAIDRRNLSIHGSSSYATATSAMGQATMTGRFGLSNDLHTHNPGAQTFRPHDVSDARALQFAHELRHFRETLGEPRSQPLGLGRFENNPYETQRLPLSGHQMLDQGIDPSRIPAVSRNHPSFFYDSSSMPLPSLPRVPHMHPTQESRTLFPHHQTEQRNLFQQQQNVELRALQVLEREQQLRSRFLDSQFSIPQTQRFINNGMSPMGSSYLPISTPLHPTNATSFVTPSPRLSETLPYNPNHHFLRREGPPFVDSKEKRRKKKKKRKKSVLDSPATNEGRVLTKKRQKLNSSDTSLSSHSSGNSLIGSNEKYTTDEAINKKPKSDKGEEKRTRGYSSSLDEDSVNESGSALKDKADATSNERESDKSPTAGLEALSAAASLMRE